MPPDLALSSTLIGSNYPCLELIFMVPKVFEPLKFDCSYLGRKRVGVMVANCILGLFHYYMLDKSFCHFRGVRSVLLL